MKLGASLGVLPAKEPDGQRSGGGRCLQVDIVEGSQVHWRLTSPQGTYAAFCNVLAELPLLVAAKLPPDGELYEPLLWELELIGLRGP